MVQQTRFIEKADGWYGPPIDPEEEKDYQLDLSLLLGTDTISSVTWEATSGIAIVAAKNTNTVTTATVWLTGAVSGQVHTITAHVVTAAGRGFDRSFKLVGKSL